MDLQKLELINIVTQPNYNQDSSTRFPKPKNKIPLASMISHVFFLKIQPSRYRFPNSKKGRINQRLLTGDWHHTIFFIETRSVGRNWGPWTGNNSLIFLEWNPCCPETLSTPSIKVDSWCLHILSNKHIQAWCCQTASLSILGHLQTGEEHADANDVLQKQAGPPCTCPIGRSSLHAKRSFCECMFLPMLKHTLVNESLLFARSSLRCWCLYMLILCLWWIHKFDSWISVIQ